MISIKDIERIATISASWNSLMRLRPELLEGIRDYFEIPGNLNDGAAPLRLLAAHISKPFNDDPYLAERFLKIMLREGWLLPYALENGDQVCIARKSTEPDDSVFCPFCGRLVP